MKEYIEIHRERFLEELKDFLRIPSVSANPAYSDDIYKASKFLISAMEEMGIQAEEFSAGGHPIVYGNIHVNDELPTVLIYGHYDVQPADPIELWDTPPFEPTIRDGKIYARGACDDKAQVYLVLKALETMLADNSLECNIKLMFEGEEEVGSCTLESFICSHKSMLSADAFLICDTFMESENQPAMINSLRGICYAEITVSGAPEDLHSGMLGGVIINPLTVLCSMLGKLKSEDHQILIPGFYDGISNVEDDDLDFVVDADLASFQAGESGFSAYKRMTIRPTLDVHGVSGGYSGEGPKTVIPSKVSAKVSMRLVEGQDEKIVFSQLENYINLLAPKEVAVQLKKMAGSNAVQTKIDSIACQSADYALETVFGNKPVYQKIGGTIPVVSMVKQHLNLDPILMGFGLDSDNIHGPNEHFHISNFFRGIETVSLFIKTYGQNKKKDIQANHLTYNLNTQL
ncbi:MAG: peptidase dimerization domain protein [Flavobacteriales bacterium]|nr:MAG: peptidase dimerization domain protein [Flavobacteriales bacterium]